MFTGFDIYEMNKNIIDINSFKRENRCSGAANGTDLATLFECPVCFDYVLPPIIQCQSGHLVCANCRPKLNCCPTCRGPLG